MPNERGRIDYAERGTVLVVTDAEQLARDAAELFITKAHAAVERTGIGTIALSGGSTPKRMGQLLAEEPFRGRVPWDRVHIFWGDERWVPLESQESNAGEAKRNFLDHVGIPDDNVHPFETSGRSPDESARRYESLIRSIASGQDHIPVFDLVLLGMGDDGHTASLFPGTSALGERDRLVVANDVPKLGATRLTMTAFLINAARSVAFLAAGAGKAEKLSEVLDGPTESHRLPSQLIRPTNGELLWLVDRTSATSLARQPE